MKLDLRKLRMPGGKTIAALEYEPPRARGVAIAVAHGYSSSKHNLDALCGFVASHGFHTISIDFPGHKLGASGGRLESIDDLTDALATAVHFVRDAYAVPVYVMGHSMGAATALRTCAADAAIAGAISIATGWGRPSALDIMAARGAVDLRSAYVDGLTLQEIVTATEPLLGPALERLAGRPALYIAAERDGMVSQASARELYRRAPEPKSFALIPSDHTSAGENARATVLAWLNGWHPR